MATGALFGSLQQIRAGTEYIKDLNKEMTNIRVVTGQSREEIDALAVSFNQTAKEMGATTLEVAQGSLEWFRQGKTAEEANELIRASLVASKLANMESAQATEYLTSILNGFKLEAEDATWVLDKLIAVDNDSATSMAELAEALKRSANSAQQAGVDFDTLTAYIATVSSVTRKSAGSIGESFKTLFARLQNLKLNQLDEMGKSASDVEKDLRTFATAIAGVRQRENFLVLMENFNDVLRYQAIQADSAGQAMERYDIYLQSVEAHANQLTASWEEMWSATINSDAVIGIIDFTRAIVELITQVGGLTDVLFYALGILILIKRQIVGTFVIGAVEAFKLAIGQLILGFSALNVNVAQFGFNLRALSLTGVKSLIAMINPATAVAMAIVAVGVAIKTTIDKYRELKAEAEEGYKYLEKQASANFEKNLEGVTDKAERQEIILRQTGAMVNYLQEQYDSLSKAQKALISEEEFLGSVFKASAKELAKESASVEDYKRKLQELADQYGFTLETFEDSDDINFVTESGVVIDLQEFNKTIQESGIDLYKYTGSLNNALDAMGSLGKETQSFTEVLGGLHSEMSKSLDIASRSLEGAFSIDDMMALTEIYDDWTDLLTIEGDIIKLNTEKMMELNLEKARQAKFKGILEGTLSKDEVAFMNAYISQLERAIPMSRDYAQFLQDVALQASELTGSLGGFSQAIGEISRQFEEGELSATQYFEALQSQLSETQFGGLETEQQQLLFTGLVSDASSALSQISSMFDAGEIDILGYSEQLMGVMGIFQQLGSIAQASGVDVSGSLDQMSNATMRLAELQELNFEIAKVVQLQASENLKVGTEEFAVYAQNMAQLAIDAGIQVQDMQGNVFTSASQIAQWMMGSQANFNAFTQQTAQATGSTIGELVGSAGDLLISLGDEISNFKGQINIVPKIDFVQTEITAGMFSIPMFLPSVTLDVTGSSTSLATIGGAVKAFGEKLKGMGSSINLSNDIYNLAKPLNQVTGAGGQVSDVYDKLQDAIGGATDKTKELADAVEEMRKKQLEALKDQLDSYNKIINKRKQLLETMSAERRYQDELEDRQKSIADLQKEILELSMDSSEEAKRRRQELEAQMSEQQKELDTFQFEHSVDQQQAMLEEERQRFEDQIAGAIKIIENIEADNVQEFINKLREALGYIPTEQSTPAPMSAIQSADAFISNQTLSSAMSGSSLTGSFSSIGDKLANLTLSGSPQITTREVNFSVEKLMEINVAGNLDESVLPDIEAISQQVIGKINEIMNLRGFARNAGSYSI